MASASTRIVEYLTGLNEAEIAPVLLQHATMAVLDSDLGISTAQSGRAPDSLMMPVSGSAKRSVIVFRAGMTAQIPRARIDVGNGDPAVRPSTGL